MKNIFDYFRAFSKQNTASLAKERLKIIVAHERSEQKSPDYLPKLKKELIDVISRYVRIDREKISVQLERAGDYSVLELNVTLPD